MSISSILSTGQIMYGGGLIAKEGVYENIKDTAAEEAAKGYHAGVSALPLLATGAIGASLVSQFQAGALYSFGAEPVVGDKGYGFVKGGMGEKYYDPFTKNAAAQRPSVRGLSGIISGKDAFFQPGGGAFSPVTPGSKSAMESQVRGLSATKMGAGVMSQSLLSTLLPAGLTMYFAADAYSNDGMKGLGKYLVGDFLGNYYGTQAAVQTLRVVDPGKANKHFKQGGGGLIKSDVIQRVAPIGGGSILGRMLPTLGGILGATVGMEIGATAGSAATALIGSGGPSDTSGAILGGLLGAWGGAKLGAYAFSSIPTAIVAGVSIAATTEVVSRGMDALKGGFDTKRGLNFAGETAHYFTKNAVTMRQRAVQSMQKSNMNARSAFGQEASLMHMNRDMFSQYKRPLR